MDFPIVSSSTPYVQYAGRAPVVCPADEHPSEATVVTLFEGFFRERNIDYVAPQVHSDGFWFKGTLFTRKDIIKYAAGYFEEAGQWPDEVKKKMFVDSEGVVSIDEVRPVGVQARLRAAIASIANAPSFDPSDVEKLAIVKTVGRMDEYTLDMYAVVVPKGSDWRVAGIASAMW